MPGPRDGTRGARALLLPAGCYLAVTVVLPALGGGWGDPAFWRHAAWVVFGCALTVGGWAAGHGILTWMRPKKPVARLPEP